MAPSNGSIWSESALAETIDFPDGPVLVLIEDVTGAGKTEAAQVIVHRLMATGRASGAYWAMPTQARHVRPPARGVNPGGVPFRRTGTGRKKR